MLFENDKDGFIDNIKFEAIMNPILDIYQSVKISEYVSYEKFANEIFIPCIVKFYSGLTDDYKLKTANYNLLLRTRSDNNTIKLTILKTLNNLVEALGERYLILVNDILPFIAETLDDLNPEVE